MKAALSAVFIVGGLFILRVAMTPTIREWAASNQVLTLPQRLLVGVVQGSLWLAALTVTVAVLVLVRSRPAKD